MTAQSWWQRFGDRWLLTSLLLISLLFMKLDSTVPIQHFKLRMLDRVAPFSGGPARTVQLLQSVEQNKLLKTQLAHHDLDFQLCREIQAENVRLRKLLDLKSRSEYPLQPAEIISWGTRGMPGSVHLNIGSDRGCRRNMALISEGGAAGRLVAVGRSTSVGQLLNDPTARISGLIQRSRVRGIVHWLYGDRFSFDGVPMHSDVAAGDTVITSGYSDIYPKGIPIGQVTSVHPDDSGLFFNIRLKSAVDFSTLETVFVVMKP